MRLLSLVTALSIVVACSAETGKEGGGSRANPGSEDASGVTNGFEAGTSEVSIGGCTAIAARATNQLQPADIVMGIDGSGSMSDEVAMVRTQINAFAKQIIDSGIDVRVIMLADYPTKVTIGTITVDGGICVPAPLGSGSCPKDHHPPHYYRPFEPAFGPLPEQGIGIGSTDMFNVFISAWPKYKDWLRAEASLTYVGVTDDDALAVDEGDRSKPLDPQINSADKFIAALAKLDPAAAAKMKYSAIFCFTECPLAATEGKIHRDLVLKTGGVMGDLCKQDFKPVWNALATKIATEAKLACEWSIPKPPGGETIDPNLVNVDAQHGDGSKIDLKKVGSKADCGTGPGWYYDDEKNPTRVLVCPATCTELQADNKAKVDVLFGCKTIVR